MLTLRMGFYYLALVTVINDFKLSVFIKWYFILYLTGLATKHASKNVNCKLNVFPLWDIIILYMLCF